MAHHVQIRRIRKMDCCPCQNLIVLSEEVFLRSLEYSNDAEPGPSRSERKRPFAGLYAVTFSGNNFHCSGDCESLSAV